MFSINKNELGYYFRNCAVKWDTRYFQKIYQTYISKWKGLQVAIPLSYVTLCDGVGADRTSVIIVHLNCPMTKKMILLTL